MGLEFRVQDLGFRVFRFPCIEGFRVVQFIVLHPWYGDYFKEP